ncbi:MAG TPA: DUF6174 domain-containing protein [Gemmatimonadales bacterium]
MLRRLALPVLALLLAVTGCEAPTAPGDRDALAEARARWRAGGSLSYSYELNRSCFCLLAGRAMRVTVDAGSVVSAEYIDSRTGVEAALLTYVPTIPDLFDLAEDALDRRADYFAAEYDPTYGFPTRIEIDYSSSAADDEVAISARNLVPGEGAAGSR